MNYKAYKVIYITFRTLGINPKLHNCKTRIRPIIFARQIASYFISENLNLKPEEIADIFNQDRCSTYHSKSKAIEMSAIDALFRTDFEKVKQCIQSGSPDLSYRHKINYTSRFKGRNKTTKLISRKKINDLRAEAEKNRKRQSLRVDEGMKQRLNSMPVISKRVRDMIIHQRMQLRSNSINEYKSNFAGKFI